MITRRRFLRNASFALALPGAAGPGLSAFSGLSPLPDIATLSLDEKVDNLWIRPAR